MLLSTTESNKTSITNCIFLGKNTASTSTGIFVQGGIANIQRNLIVGLSHGISNYDSVGNGVVAFNIVSKCGNGISSYNDSLTYRKSSWVNNISVGNTTNWRVQPTTLEYASGNIGESGDSPWATAGGTSFTMATSDFADFANNNFRPASGTSPQVDSAISFYGETTTDIADAEVPNYNNGGTEGADIGCFEYDHGYGPRPSSTTVTFQGIVAGSEIHIYDSAGNELVGVESCDANHVLTWNIPANPAVTITIIKRGLRWQKFSYTSKVGAQSIPIFQNTDLGYNNPA